MARRRYQKGCLFKKGKNWVLRYREDVLNPEGGVARILRSTVLGEFECKKDARREADARLMLFNSGAHRPQTSLSFENFWNNYFVPEVLAKRKFSTQQVYRHLAEKHLVPYFGTQKLCDITRFDVQSFVTAKHRQAYSPKTLAHLRNLLSKVFNVAISWGWLNSNPANRLELPPMERRRESRVLDLREIRKLQIRLEDPARTIFLLGLLTGLRIGEILALRLEDLDLTRRLLNVRRNVYRGHVQDSPKSRAGERHVPLAPFLSEGIKRWMALRPLNSAWLFPSEAGTPYHDRNLLRRQVWPVCQKLGFARFGWHSLRHTFSTYNGNHGVPMPVLQSLLGHATAETTMIYTHELEGPQRQAVQTLERVLFPNVPNRAVGTRKRKVQVLENRKEVGRGAQI